MSLLELLLQDSLTVSVVSLIVVIFVIVLLRELKQSYSYWSSISTRAKLLDQLIAGKSNSQLLENKWVRSNILNSKNSIDIKGGYLIIPHSLNKIVGSVYSSNNKTVPALLTSIGVAGTFLGITLGLAEFDMGNVGNDSTALLHSAALLLTGMKTAFATSLVGLVCSAVMLVILKLSMSKANKARNRFIDKVETNCIERTPFELLKEIANNTQTESGDQLTEAIGNLSTNLGAQLDKLAGKIGGFNGDELSVKVGDAVSTSLKSEFIPVMKELCAELKNLKEENTINHKLIVSTLIEEMESKLISPISEQLKETASAVNMSNTVNEQLNQNVERMLAEIANTVSTIDTFNQQTMDKLQSFASSLNEILATFKEDTKGTMEDITIKVSSVLEMAEKGMDSQRIAFDESTQKAAVAFEEMGTELDKSLTARTEKEIKLFADIEKRLEALLAMTSESFEEQTKVISETGQAASQLMESAQEQLRVGLGDIDNKVLNMSRTVQSELEAFREQYQNNLNDFFNQQNNLLEDTLGKQRNNLVEVVERFKNVFEQEYQTRHNLLQELTAQYEHLQASVATIERLVEAIGLTETSTFSKLEDIARNVGTQVGELKKEYAEASAVFKEISEGLPKAMQKYFETANQSSDLYFKGFDEAASKIHNRLAQAADFLIEAKAFEKSVNEQEAENAY